MDNPTMDHMETNHQTVDRRNVYMYLRKLVRHAEQKPDVLVFWAALALAIIYVIKYLSYIDLPGNRIDYPLGWWGWFDQSKILESAQAFRKKDFSANHHWYPLGYSLIGSLFVRRMPMHAFFLIDAISLLTVFYAFVALCRRLSISAGWAVAIFFAATVADNLFFAQWIIPWNTTPTAALLWLLIANVAAYCDGKRRPILIGLLAGVVPTFRPIELAIVVPCLLSVLAMAVQQKGRKWYVDIIWLSLAALLPLGCYAVLHIYIYGFQASDYMNQSKDMGFSDYNIFWKAYVILIEPRAWFQEGEGLLHHEPWIMLGLAGLIPALTQCKKRALLAIVIVCHALVYLCYVDFLPSGLWRYNLIHYWVWTFPAYGVLAFLLLRDIAFPTTLIRRQIAVIACLATILIFCIRIDPVETKSGSSFAVDFFGPTPSFAASYFDRWQLRDEKGILRNINDVRGQPISGGLRVFSIKRKFYGNTSWNEESPFKASNSDSASIYWDYALRFGRPCWMPLMYCQFP